MPGSQSRNPRLRGLGHCHRSRGLSPPPRPARVCTEQATDPMLAALQVPAPFRAS